MNTVLTAPLVHLSCAAIKGLRVGFILFLTLLISGLLPMLIQSYGWYDMAQKAGGMEHIVQVITEAPACKFCKAARALQQKSEPEPQTPAGGDRVEVLKTYAVYHDDDLHPRQAPKVLASGGNIGVDDVIFPHGLLIAPEVPPPQCVA